MNMPENEDADFVLAEVNRYRRVSLVTRIILAVLSGAQLLVAIPWLFGSSPLFGAATADLHLTRDGALGIVFGVSGLAVALRTQTAWFALPLVFVLLLLQTFFAFVDHQASHVTTAFESFHLLGAAIGVVIALFIRPREPSATRRNGLRKVR
jgi:hypothetical protein